MKNKYKVSIIVPCYNSEEWIVKCLDSIPKREDIEVIVVNDGSTDLTIYRLQKYKEKEYKELKIIDYKTNKGVSYARNKALDKAKGEYILMLDSDDYIYSNVFIEIVDDYLDENFDMVFYNMENNVKYIFVADLNNFQCKYGNFKFIKREFLGNLRYTVGKQYAEDKELHLKLLAKNPSCIFVAKTMYHYNFPRKGSLSAIGENR